MLVLFFFFILRTSNLLDQTGLAQGTVLRSKISLAVTSNCTLSRNGPWVQMDRNSSGSVFSWPDAGGSRPEAMGLHERGPKPGTGGRAPRTQNQGWELTPRYPSKALSAGKGANIWLGYVCLARLLLTQARGSRPLQTQPYAFLYFFFSFHLNLLQFYLQTLGNQMNCDLQ